MRGTVLKSSVSQSCHASPTSQTNSKEQFMEAKAAFETLVDAGKRAEYDRKMRMVGVDNQ